MDTLVTKDIEKVLSRLSQRQQELLCYAARECICQYVQYESGHYIGVHAEYNKKLVPEIQDGCWSIGTFNS